VHESEKEILALEEGYSEFYMKSGRDLFTIRMVGLHGGVSDVIGF
jgi:hypothetical protein